MAKPGTPKKASKKRKKVRLPDALSGKELTALLDAPSRRSILGIRARCVLALMGKCGLRVSEVCGLETTDVRLDADAPFVRVIGKGDKERRAFLGGGMVALLKQWIEIRPKGGRGRALFPVVRGGRRGLGIAKPGRAISRRSVGHMVKGFAVKAGIKRKVKPHMLRHTAATLALRSGEDLRKIQKMMGHKDISTIQIYTHIQDDELANMADRLDPGRSKSRQILDKDLAELMERIQRETGGSK